MKKIEVYRIYPRHLVYQLRLFVLKKKTKVIRHSHGLSNKGKLEDLEVGHASRFI